MSCVLCIPRPLPCSSPSLILGAIQGEEEEEEGGAKGIKLKKYGSSSSNVNVRKRGEVLRGRQERGRNHFVFHGHGALLHTILHTYYLPRQDF